MTFSGGEPGLRSDLASLINEASSLGLEVTVFTNGRAANPEILDRIAEAEGRIAVSLDGPEPAPHEALRGSRTFKAARATLEMAIDALGGERVILSTVLSRPLLPYLEQHLEFALSLGVSTLYLGVFEPLSGGVKHPLAPSPEELIQPVLRLLDAAERSPEIKLLFSESDDLINAETAFCSRDLRRILGRTVKVQADGWAMPGPFYYDPRFRLGRPSVEGWQAVNESVVKTRLRRLAETRFRQVIECRCCFWVERCRGGSLALTWETYGAWNVPCTMCKLYKATLERVARRTLTNASSTRS